MKNRDLKAEELLKENSVISVVGAGGKTSLLLHLKKAAESRGQPAIITTTTHMYRPGELFYTGEQKEEIEALLDQKKAVWVGEEAEDKRKIKGVAEELLREISKKAVYTLIEADGARHFPCKVPAEHEPVIPKETNLVIGTAGLDCLGRPLREVCFRAELAAGYLGMDTQGILTEEGLADILAASWGAKKALPPGAAYGVVLNKCDLQGAREAGERVRQLLWQRGIDTVVLCSLGKIEN